MTPQPERQVAAGSMRTMVASDTTLDNREDDDRQDDGAGDLGGVDVLDGPWARQAMPTVGDATDPQAVARALADVVGTEPGPRDVRAAYRTPVPGLGPLDRLERVVRAQVATLAAHGVPPESIVLHLRRVVRDCLPSHTADWSAHLLTEAVVRWSIGEGGAAQ